MGQLATWDFAGLKKKLTKKFNEAGFKSVNVEVKKSSELEYDGGEFKETFDMMQHMNRVLFVCHYHEPLRSTILPIAQALKQPASFDRVRP